MSWDAVNPQYRAISILGQIRDLSEGINLWATNFESRLDLKVQTVFTVSIWFTEKQPKEKATSEKIIYKYDASDLKGGENFKALIEKIKGFALGKQHSFGVFVKMEDLEDPDWALSIQENFLSCVIQVRDGYTRDKMLKKLGLIENTDCESRTSSSSSKRRKLDL